MHPAKADTFRCFPLVTIRRTRTSSDECCLEAPSPQLGASFGVGMTVPVVITILLASATLPSFCNIFVLAYGSTSSQHRSASRFYAVLAIGNDLQAQRPINVLPGPLGGDMSACAAVKRLVLDRMQQEPPSEGSRSACSPAVAIRCSLQQDRPRKGQGL